MKTKKTVQKSASVTEKEAACAAYIDAVNDIYRKGNCTEVSYRDALSPLLWTLLPNRGVTNEPKPMERNKPDYTITADPDGGLLSAYRTPRRCRAADNHVSNATCAARERTTAEWVRATSARSRPSRGVENAKRGPNWSRTLTRQGAHQRQIYVTTLKLLVRYRSHA